MGAWFAHDNKNRVTQTIFLNQQIGLPGRISPGRLFLCGKENQKMQEYWNMISRKHHKKLVTIARKKGRQSGYSHAEHHQLS